ncbi:MAG: hypothetical protein IT290_12520 [Deltaproteobacteria bacterium]|nr:hypothetical protein [Deltaproteobacteria bacterium]
MKDAAADFQKYKADNGFGSRSDDEIQRQLERVRARAVDLSDHDAAVKAQERALAEASKLAGEGRRIAADSHKDATQRTKDVERQHAGLLDPEKQKSPAKTEREKKGGGIQVPWKTAGFVATGTALGGYVVYDSYKRGSGNPTTNAIGGAIDKVAEGVDQARDATMRASESSAESSPTNAPPGVTVPNGSEKPQTQTSPGTGSSSVRQMNLVVPSTQLDEIVDRMGDEFYNTTVQKYQNNPKVQTDVLNAMADPLAVKAYVEHAGIMFTTGENLYSATSVADMEKVAASAYKRISEGWAISQETQVGGAVEKVTTHPLKYRVTSQEIDEVGIYRAFRKLLDTEFGGVRYDQSVSNIIQTETVTTPDGREMTREFLQRVTPDNKIPADFGATDSAYHMTLRFLQLHNDKNSPAMPLPTEAQKR